jgi:CheY-like chemotaxis protein
MSQVTNKPRLLLIDDDPSFIEMVEERLKHAPFDLAFAAGGKRGFKAFLQAKLEGRPFDLVVTDLAMPGQGSDGLSLIQNIRKVDSEICIVVVTAYNEPMAHLAAGVTHVADIWDKNNLIPDLDTRIEKALSQHCLNFRQEKAGHD